MEKNKRKDVHRRTGGYFEMKAHRSDDYQTLLQCTKKKFPSVTSEKKCHLFRSNGARIKNEDLTIKEASKPWTLGGYLQYLHVSPDILRLGIGFESSSEESEEELPIVHCVSPKESQVSNNCS